MAHSQSHDSTVHHVTSKVILIESETAVHECVKGQRREQQRHQAGVQSRRQPPFSDGDIPRVGDVIATGFATTNKGDHAACGHVRVFLNASRRHGLFG